MGNGYIKDIDWNKDGTPAKIRLKMFSGVTVTLENTGVFPAKDTGELHLQGVRALMEGAKGLK